MNHDFETLTDKKTETTYKKCKRCRKVLLPNDDYFNMICQVKTMEREQLRKKLENA
jgi:hypothetical protein